MAKTGVDLEEWKSLTDGVASSTKGISKLKSLTFTETTLKPFSDFNKNIKKFNASIKKLKTFTKDDADKMYKAGKNKADDDAKEAEHTRSKGGK